MDKKDIETRAPEPLKKFAQNPSLRIEELFSNNRETLQTLKEKKVANVRMPDGTDAKIAAEISADGEVLAMAAAVSRTPTTSDKYLKDNVPDLKKTKELPRKQRLELYQQVYAKEGIINNAIKKKASIVSQDGNFMVRAAKQGKRPVQKVSDELTVLLTWWEENVNAADNVSAITGSKGIRQVVRRGVRQALITGDLFLRAEWVNVDVPVLGKKYRLPMFLHALPSEEVAIAEEFLGLGIDLYYWEPDRAKIQKVINSRDPNVRKQVDRAISADILNELRKKGKALLDSALIIHIKNAGTDSDAYGQSDVESALTDIAYARALKSLDFVTIDSLINRMLIVKIGDENPESEYHNLAVAQARVNTLSRLISEVGPNMLILWAGHDISTEDASAHNSILNTDQRHELAKDLTKLATGVPDPLLTGSADGGNAVAWAGFISLAAVAAELQEEWSQALTQLGHRIAQQNKFKDVDIIWQFSQRLLADREANAKLMIQAYDRGVLSRRTLAEELGKDFDVEIARRRNEVERGFDDLFLPPNLLTTNPGGNQGTDPERPPGRPDRQTDTKVGPDRDRETRTTTTTDSS